MSAPGLVAIARVRLAVCAALETISLADAALVLTSILADVDALRAAADRAEPPREVAPPPPFEASPTAPRLPPPQPPAATLQETAPPTPLPPFRHLFRRAAPVWEGILQALTERPGSTRADLEAILTARGIAKPSEGASGNPISTALYTLRQRGLVRREGTAPSQWYPDGEALTAAGGGSPSA